MVGGAVVPGANSKGWVAGGTVTGLSGGSVMSIVPKVPLIGVPGSGAEWAVAAQIESPRPTHNALFMVAPSRTVILFTVSAERVELGVGISSVQREAEWSNFRTSRVRHSGPGAVSPLGGK
jgi:hypothetical protein